MGRNPRPLLPIKKAIVAAIAVAFFVSTAAEARGGRGFSGGRSFSRPAPTKSYAPKRTTVVKSMTKDDEPKQPAQAPQQPQVVYVPVGSDGKPVQQAQ